MTGISRSFDMNIIKFGVKEKEYGVQNKMPNICWAALGEMGGVNMHSRYIILFEISSYRVFQLTNKNKKQYNIIFESEPVPAKP